MDRIVESYVSGEQPNSSLFPMLRTWQVVYEHYYSAKSSISCGRAPAPPERRLHKNCERKKNPGSTQTSPGNRPQDALDCEFPRHVRKKTSCQSTN